MKPAHHPSRFEVTSYVYAACATIQDQVRTEHRKDGTSERFFKKGSVDRLHYAAWLLDNAAHKLRRLSVPPKLRG